MSIKAIVGLTGSGKSLRAVELIMKFLEKNIHVVTNIPLNFDHEYLHNWEWEVIDSGNPSLDFFSDYPLGSVYFLDECANSLGAGQSIKQASNRKLTFFTMHRHRALNGRSDDIYIIAQNLAQIASWVRNLIEQTTICEKPTEFGVTNMSIRHTHSGAIVGNGIVRSKLISSSTVKVNPDLYKFYSSHTQSLTTDEEVSFEVIESNDTATLFGSMKFKAFILLGIVSLIIMVWGGWHTATKTVPRYQKLDSLGTPAPTPTSVPIPASITTSTPIPVSTTPVAVPVSTTTPTLAPIPTPVLSMRWRVAGYLRSKKMGERIVFADISGHTRMVDTKLCKSDDYNQYTCMVDGELVNLWSGIYSGASINQGLSIAANKVK